MDGSASPRRSGFDPDETLFRLCHRPRGLAPPYRLGPRLGATPSRKTKYDVIIVGAGGHGLATAYYLGKNHGITNVAVLEKGWLGGGNTGRNTTIIRSNYLQDPSAAIYEKARCLYETMSQDLNYNVMFSPRGVIMLAQTQHEVRGYQRTAHANALQGVTTEFIGPERVKELCPIMNIDGPRYPVLGGLWQARGGTARHDAVAWGYARACSDMGMDIIQQCEVTGVRREGGKVVGVDTTKGADRLRQAGHGRGGPFRRAGARWRGSGCRSKAWPCRRWCQSRSSPAWMWS